PKPVLDPEQAKAEREKRIQQLPPELQALIRDRSLLNPRTGDKPTATEDRKPVVDPEQAKAERKQRIQQLPPELQAIIRDRSLLDPGTTGKGTATEDRAEMLRRLKEERIRRMNATASPNTESSDTQPSSPFPSPPP